ncbi:MAG: hypothetical protein ABI380_11615 [Edaphobacter sp.]
MDSPNRKSPFSASEPPPGPSMDSSAPPESLQPIRTDRLYQIAALTAGIILLATVF